MEKKEKQTIMKEHVQDYGVRKWAGDDLIELQAEPLSALQALVAPYAPCILTGCELETVPGGNGDGSPAYRLHAGYVALKGRKTVDNGAGAGTDGTDTGTGGTGNEVDAGVAATAENGDTAVAQDEEYVKIVRVTAQTVKQPTVFLALACTPVSRAYGNGENKAIAYDYTAEVCDVLSKVGDRPYLTLVANAENPRLPDTLGITRKLDRDGGEAQDTVVKFTDDGGKDAPEDLQSGLTLGVLISRIKKCLGNKVDTKEGYGLSKNDFDDVWMQKLDDIEPNANNYVHPTYTSRTGSQGSMTPKFGGVAHTYTYNVDTQGHVTGSNSRTITIPSTKASSSEAGLMSAADKIKLDGIATGATKVIVDSALSSSSTNPVQNKAVSTALAGKSDSGHSHSWDNITSKPSIALSNHTHTPSSIGAASTAVATSSSAGLMSAADKKKLDNIANVTITTNGSKLTFSWKHPTLNYTFKATLDGGSESGGVTA